MEKPNHGIDYEGTWDAYAEMWQELHPELDRIGDEWIGKGAGAASTGSGIETLIEQRFIQPYIGQEHRVLEIGVGVAKPAHCCLNTAKRSSVRIFLENARGHAIAPRGDRVSYLKLDGLTLKALEPHSVDVCFCYDTMVHLEPRDIFNYLTQIPALLQGDRLCVFHHTNILSELGWQKFLSEWHLNLRGQRHGSAFSVMTDHIMEKFLTHLNYEILVKDTQSVPRDCVWVCKAPIV